jgi:hypothetical protein
MSMKTEPYWNDPTLIIYGLLGGFTQLTAEDINQALSDLMNVDGNVVACIEVLATLEGLQKIRTGGVWLDLREYLGHLDDQNTEETDELTAIISKVQNIADWEPDNRSVLRSNFMEILEQREIVTEALHGCIVEFSVRVLEQGWIKQVLLDYLERYRQNELFTPTAPAYIVYRQQLVAATNLLEVMTLPKTISRFLLPNNLRFLESLYDLVDRRKIALAGFSNLTKPSDDPLFGVIVNSVKQQSLRQVDTSRVRLEAGSYDPASGILKIAGEDVDIISQKNKFGKAKESKAARLVRLLFVVNTFPEPVSIRHIYTVRGDIYPQDVKKKARSLVTAINKKVKEKTGINDVISCDGWRFYITDHYLKK